MDPHPETDLDAPMSNPQEEEDRMEDQFESGDEEEEEEEDLDDNGEDPSGVNAPPTMSRHDSPVADFFRREHLQIEERKRLERELLVQKELMIKREEPPPYLGVGSTHNGGSSSKSTTPSPTSPPQMQYLYAANHQFAAAAAAAALFNPSHLAAAAAAAQSVAAAAAAQVASGGHHAGALTPTGGNGGSSTGSATPTNAGDDQSKYTFEEQFKQEPPTTDFKRRSNSLGGQGARPEQLYEISDDPRRREFLDDLFNFMQKRGTPVNRVPIMAKQVLDLYELYRLVVARGGLVEVINKKIWREITKGLNLPSSITSAAFTLRTQYMRYLYPYECDREKLSTAEELQAAIDGNRREGRRSSYGPYGDMVGPAMVPVSKNSPHQPLSSPLSLVSRHVNGHGSTHGGLSSGRGSASPLPLAYYHNNSTSAPLPLNLAHQENGIYGSHGLSSGCGNRSDMLITHLKQEKDPPQLSLLQERQINSKIAEEDNCNSISSTPNPMVMPQQEALNLEVSRNSTNIDQKPLNMKRRPHDEEENLIRDKRRLLTEEERLLSRTTMPSTHIKITSNRGHDGRTQSDGSLMVSMEVNGIMYQGVLFAMPHHRNRL